ncbi:MAG: sigma-54 dependent transcriptional regulator [Terriglobia bacterium]|jgi:two-component system response regulator AtoC
MSTTDVTPATLGAPVDDLPPEEVIFGQSEAMRHVQQKVRKLASANIPVLIQGESGTGKEVIAKLIHRLSPWQSGPFVKVNCPAIPGTLLESELFGYERGAFTGAYGSKPGRVEMANRGTLFLDEIAELDAGLQAKLLQLLQDGQFCRIGAREDTRVEARVVCATNRQLEKETEAGTFRQDLFYRINVLNVRMPPLRQRVDDIPGLASYFLRVYNHQFDCRVPELSAATTRHLQRRTWTGNIRELENLIKRYVILGSEDAIMSAEAESKRPSDMMPAIPLDGPISLKKVMRQMVREMEGKIILKVLEAENWNRKRTAHSLSISYRALLYKIREAGLPSKSKGETKSKHNVTHRAPKRQRHGVPADDFRSPFTA